MAKKLAVNVLVVGEDGSPHALYAGETVPDWAAEQVGEHCFDADRDDEDVAPELESEEGSSGIPPKSGRGSGAKAWASYAQANGLDVDEDASKDDIIAALEAAGVPTE
jgi:hypothetical protein